MTLTLSPPGLVAREEATVNTGPPFEVVFTQPGDLDIQFRGGAAGFDCYVKSVGSVDGQLKPGLLVAAVRPLPGGPQYAVTGKLYSDIIHIIRQSSWPLSIWFWEPLALSSAPPSATAIDVPVGRLAPSPPASPAGSDVPAVAAAASSSGLISGLLAEGLLDRPSKAQQNLRATVWKLHEEEERETAEADVSPPPLSNAATSPPPLGPATPPPLAPAQTLKGAAQAAMAALAGAQEALLTPTRSVATDQVTERLQAATLEHEAAIATCRSTHATEVAAMQQEHRLALEGLPEVAALRADHRLELGRLRTVSDGFRREAQQAQAESEQVRATAKQAHDTGVLRATMAAQQHTGGQMQGLKEAHAEKVTAMNTQHGQQLAVLCAGHDKAIATKNSEHEEAVEALQAEHSELMSMTAMNTKAENAEAVAALTSELTAEVGVYRSETENAAQELAQTLAANSELASKFEADVTGYEAQLQSLQEEHQQSVVALHTAHAELVSATVQAVEAKRHDAVEVLAADHVAEVERLQAESESASEQLEKSLAAKFQTESATHEGQLRTLEDTHLLTLASLKTEHGEAVSVAVQEAEAANQHTVGALEAAHTAEVERLQVESDSSSTELEERIASKFEVESREHDVQLRALTEEHERAQGKKDDWLQVTAQLVSPARPAAFSHLALR